MTVAASAVTVPRSLRRATALRGTLAVPSDKSIAHRALICAALASGPSRIRLRDPGADVLSTVGALRALGIEFEIHRVGAEAEVRVNGKGDSEIGRLGPGVADCGNSGTSMRLLMGALAPGSGPATLIGDTSLSARPMERVAAPLRAMGADIELSDGRAPVVVRGQRPLHPAEHRLEVASAQVVAGISLAALAAEGTTTVTVPGTVRDHTECMLRALGADVQRIAGPGRWSTTTIRGQQRLQPFERRIPGDFSSAAAWIVAASIHPDAEVHLSDVGLNPTRTALLDALRSMGADIMRRTDNDEVGEPSGEIVVRGGTSLHAIDLGPDAVPSLIDELPLLAVAMAAADGTSEVRGAAELRVKESDRISAMAAALAAAGAHVEELPDGWRISKGRARDARVRTHGDHRVAIAMAVAACTGVASCVELDDAECVCVSYPSFWDDARSVGAFS